jgi:NAD+ synthase (glutamine-hydrolysing)
LSETLRIVLAQLDFLVGDIEGNVARIVAASERARDELRAHMVVFPELTLTGYPPEDLLYRSELHRRVQAGLDELCRVTRGIDVVVGYPRLSGSSLFNAAALLRDGEVVAVYHKHALPNYSVFDEKRYFVSSDGSHRACVVNVGPDIPVAITICEDIWVSEPLRWAAEAGARIVLNLNASPFHKKKGGVREAMVRERVSEVGLPVVYVNLVGGQDELVFDGGSFVMDAAGQVSQRAADFSEGLYPVDFEVADVPRPIAADVQRCATVEESVYRALVLGVRDYIRKNGFGGAVLGLSGGIDSALTAAIAVDAIGPDRVEAVLMPSRFTADMSIEDAVVEARALGIAHRIIPIEPPFQAFLDSLEKEFAGMDSDVTEENIQARCRGVILMAISNKLGRILLTTGNKSEMAVGYATLYGDMAGGFAPIKDVPKTFVYRLAQYRNEISPVIPQRVLRRAPSAELAPDQKDEDSLPPYHVLDSILERYVERDQGVAEIIAEGFGREIVHRVARMVDRNEYKRRQAPPGVRITHRAFGRDRRYPITSGFGNRDGS